MRRTSTPLLLALSLALLSGCPASSPAPGSASLSLSLPQALAVSVSRVTVTVSAAEASSVSGELVFSDGVWKGLLGNLPPGDNRTFLARAFDASGTLLFEGSTSGVSIASGKTALVSLTLQPIAPPSPFLNAAPRIDALTVASPSVYAGGTLSFAVTAQDADPGDTLSYAWSSTAGAFSPASSASTVWTAPDATGLQTVTVTVTDAHGLSASLSRAISVTPSTPRITFSSRTSATAAPGQELTFEVVASDPRNSELSFSWSANTGSLGTAANGETTSRILWTAPSCSTASLPPSATLTVTVTNSFHQTSVRHFEVRGLPFCVTPNWTPAGAMASARANPTATLLLDGRVLLAGGINYSEYPAKAEVYDPASGTWSVTGPLASPRMNHTATRLLDGRVLVVGGSNGNLSAFFATAEVYDPASGTWSATGSMAVGRQGHTVTLLPDGKVLVAGGSGFGFFATAEVYDPASGTWSATGSMASPRDGHTATLLPGGKVLVAGGRDGHGGSPATAEVYDPASGTWSTTGAMVSPREEHAAALLPGGKVLLVGGRGPSNTHMAAAEVYDPASGTWSATAPMALPRLLHTATPLLDGRVLVVGGFNSEGPLPMAEVYDPASGTWSPGGVMAVPRADHTATLLSGGKVLVSGGSNSSSERYPTAAESYTP